MIRLLRAIADLKAACEERDRLRVRVGELESALREETDGNRLREIELVRLALSAAKGPSAPLPFIPSRRPTAPAHEAKASGESIITDEEMFVPEGYTEEEIRYAADQYLEAARQSGVEYDYNILLETIRRHPEQYV